MDGIYSMSIWVHTQLVNTMSSLQVFGVAYVCLVCVCVCVCVERGSGALFIFLWRDI